MVIDFGSRRELFLDDFLIRIALSDADLYSMIWR